MKVLVGMSGGVDSSVAALLLKEQGYEVIGATMSLWGKSDFFEMLGNKINSKEKKVMTHCACLSPDKGDDISQAKNLAEKLGIKHYVIDCSKEFENTVINNFKNEYLLGRTPNPCVCCNKNIKFNVFQQKARSLGIEYDKFATGHYAKIEFENGKYVLKRGANPKKDQSYFLYGLTQEQLSKTIFPLGNYTKEEIRDIAKQHGFAVAEKPDSQDFYGGDYNDILNRQPQKGNFVDINGKILGVHQGFWNYTVGQRKGIGISAAAPLYVIELRKETNEVVVGFKETALNKGLYANELVLNLSLEENKPFQCFVKIRSSQEPKKATVELQNNIVKVEFEEIQTSIATGQSAVFYDNDRVIGGGIIASVF